MKIAGVVSAIITVAGIWLVYRSFWVGLYRPWIDDLEKRRVDLKNRRLEYERKGLRL